MRWYMVILMDSNGDFNGMDLIGIYPLVNVDKNYDKSPFLIGKSTISMGHLPWANCECLPEGKKRYQSIPQEKVGLTNLQGA